MKILYIAPYISHEYKEFLGNDNIGSLAATNKIELIAKILSQMGHEVLILSSINFHSDNQKIKKSYLEFKNIDDIKIRIFYPFGIRIGGVGGFFNIIFSRLIINKIENLFKSEVIIAYNPNLFEYIASYVIKNKRDIPLILELEDLPYARKRGINPKPIFDSWSMQKMINLADGFTAVSPGIQLMLPNNKPSILLPGIISPLLERISNARAIPFRREQKILGYFGGLSEGKGVEVLLELVSKLPENWKIYVCGMGNLSPKFKEISIVNEGLNFFGVLSTIEMYRLMNLCDALLVPTESSANKIGGVFPFKIFEYCISKAHIISPSIPYLDQLNLKFISRWDGGIKNLVAVLNSAENDYNSEFSIRDQAIEDIKSQYNIISTGTKLNDLINLLNEKKK